MMRFAGMGDARSAAGQISPRIDAVDALWQYIHDVGSLDDDMRACAAIANYFRGFLYQASLRRAAR